MRIRHLFTTILFATLLLVHATMAREQHEKEAKATWVVYGTIGVTPVPNRLDVLEARVDALEAMLERVHVVGVRDSIYVDHWRVLGTSTGWLGQFTPTDSTYLGKKCHHFTRYEISFEPDSMKEEQ